MGERCRFRGGVRFAALAAACSLSLVAPASAGVALQSVATGFQKPLWVTHADDGTNRLFVVEQAGVIRVLDTNRSLLPDPFLDIRSIVRSQGSEQGLLGLAFHPGYATNGTVVVDYTDTAGDTVVARYRVSAGDPNRLDPASAEVLLTQDQPFSNHNGGQVTYGPDGFLYVALGDGGLANDPFFHGQNPTTILGTLLRLDVGPTGPYAIPPTNPYVGSPLFREEIWAHGLRNPWRFSFDRATGDLFIADVGQNLWEEVNFQPASSTGGENYGWSLFEGTHLTSAGTVPTPEVPPFTHPVHEYDHGQGCSVTGGYVYRGSAIPDLVGTYVFGDFCSGVIWGLRNEGGTWTREPLLDTSLGISSFGEDEAGELYVTDHFGGTVHRFIPAP